MNTTRHTAAALLLLALSAASLAGIKDPGGPGGDPGDPGGGDPVTPLIDPAAIIAPLVEQLAPLLIVAIAFGLAIFAVRQGAAMMLRQLGFSPPPPRGFVPTSTGSADLDLAQAEGYLEARKRDAKRRGAASYRQGRDSNTGGARLRSSNNSRGSGRRR